MLEEVCWHRARKHWLVSGVVGTAQPRRFSGLQWVQRGWQACFSGFSGPSAQLKRF